MPFLEIRSLSFTYNRGIRAVDDLSLDAGQGELIALAGPNAAGKSTLALLMKGMLTPDSGSITVGGQKVEGGGPNLRVGILFSNPENQIVTSVVEEDIAFSLEVAACPSENIHRKVHAVMEELGIEHLGKRMPHLLSGGEQQMVALAGVLVQEPEVLILDEPTTFLDPDGKAAVLSVLRGLASRGKTIILITHDMNEACRSDRIVLMEKGRIVRDETPRSFFGPSSDGADMARAPFLFGLYRVIRDRGVDISDPMDLDDVFAAFRTLLKKSPIPAPLEPAPPGVTERPGEVLGFSDIRFGYGLSGKGTDLFRGLNLGVPEGSFSLICGNNGSGKSTLLQMGNGLIEPDQGIVAFQGVPLTVLRKKGISIPARISLLFQNPERQLFSDTVFDDIAFGPRNLGLGDPEVQRRVLEACEWAGFPPDILDRPIYALSGGQLRKAAIAGVLAMDPRVLILDEPTDGLDPSSAVEFYRRAADFRKARGITLFVAAHRIPDEVHAVDHFSHLEKGFIRSSGPVGRVLTGPERTLPERFLPDHLRLQEKLHREGFLQGEIELDSARARENLLHLIKGTGDPGPFR
ncbi:MAG: ATP-binding cassette domain-containing protein [Proteobacteria bacterium]|nr:ATP-binding cassette domain-containing protein [Pseudomonadota bacterium]